MEPKYQIVDRKTNQVVTDDDMIYAHGGWYINYMHYIDSEPMVDVEFEVRLVEAEEE